MNRFKEQGWGMHSLYFEPEQWSKLKEVARLSREPLSVLVHHALDYTYRHGGHIAPEEVKAWQRKAQR